MKEAVKILTFPLSVIPSGWVKGLIIGSGLLILGIFVLVRIIRNPQLKWSEKRDREEVFVISSLFLGAVLTFTSSLALVFG